MWRAKRGFLFGLSVFCIDIKHHRKSLTDINYPNFLKHVGNYLNINHLHQIDGVPALGTKKDRICRSFFAPNYLIHWGPNPPDPLGRFAPKSGYPPNLVAFGRGLETEPHFIRRQSGGDSRKTLRSAIQVDRAWRFSLRTAAFWERSPA